jgi:Protein of unknown function, DUF273
VAFFWFKQRISLLCILFWELLLVLGKEKASTKAATKSTKNTNNKEEEEEEEESDGDDVEPDGDDAKTEEEKKEESTDSTAEDLGIEFDSKMSAALTFKRFSMAFECPFIIYDYVNNGCKVVSVDFLIPPVHRRHVRLKIRDDGLALELSIVVPTVFSDPNRLLHANNYRGDFNHNTHKATAFQITAREIVKACSVFVFDADVFPYRTEVPLDHWHNITMGSNESLVFYVRSLSYKIAAGNYQIRNTPSAREFLRSWAAYQFQQPWGFSSKDNGALHIHLMRSLGLGSEQYHLQNRCGSMYTSLDQPVENLTDYWNFIRCTRDFLTDDTVFSEEGLDRSYIVPRN